MPIRFVAMAVFALSSALNFLDRQILAALAPQIIAEFRLTQAGYGDIVLAFSLTYAIVAPLAGWWIGRIGLTRGSVAAVSLWSLAGMATGAVRGLGGLITCRALLGVTEAAGIPGSGKASALYLKPGERALGSAISQVGLTLGMVAAPLLAQACSARWGWRSAFYIAGALGFLWVPLWLGVSRRVPAAAREPSAAPRAPIAAILRDTRYWGLIAANLLLMSAYTLWVNWTTLYLVAAHGLTQAEANLRLAWLPPIFATLGGFAGGWLSLRWTPRAGLVNARLRVIGVGVALLACGVVIPWLPSAGWAAAGISLSFFACVLASVNVYALPIDLFGPDRAAFTVSGLTSVYGLLQGVFGSLAGRVIDAHGYTPVLLAAALLPVAAYAVLSATVRHR